MDVQTPQAEVTAPLPSPSGGDLWSPGRPVDDRSPSRPRWVRLGAARRAPGAMLPPQMKRARPTRCGRGQVRSFAEPRPQPQGVTGRVLHHQLWRVRAATEVNTNTTLTHRPAAQHTQTGPRARARHTRSDRKDPDLEGGSAWEPHSGQRDTGGWQAFLGKPVAQASASSPPRGTAVIREG